MERELKKAKSQIERELSGFVFDEGMKRQVFRQIDGKTRSVRNKRSKIAPLLVTAAFLLVSSTGIYHLTDKYSQDQNLGSGHDLETPGDKDKKPALIYPDFVPEGYVYEHMKTSGESYQHVFLNEKNNEEYFTYTMQKEIEGLEHAGSAEIALGPDLKGVLYKSNDGTHSILYWQDEGFYQAVEKEGSLSQSDFLRIADSILEAKGHRSYLSEEIARLEAEDAAIDDQEDNQPENQDRPSVNEDTEGEEDDPSAIDGETEKDDSKGLESVPLAPPALTKEKAKELMTRFRQIERAHAKDIGDDYKYKSFSTKKELYSEFTDFMDYSLIDNIFGHMLEEKEDGLYAIPMGSPIYMDEQAPFSIVKINDVTYKLKQNYQSEVHGNVNLEVVYRWTEDKWIIAEINWLF
jgi:Domain of unknown function (DUF4367)